MLYVKLFGAPSLAWNGEPLELPRRQARALLYRLAADTQPVPREQLTFLFWPDVPESRARKNLSRLSSYLGRALPEEGLLISSGDAIELKQAHISVDVLRFERLLEEEDAALLEEVVTLFRGTFLSGFYLANSPEFDRWTSARAERLENGQRSALNRLVILKESEGDWAGAIEHAQRYLALDDLAEQMHRHLIQLYINSGDRAAALRQYELCVAVLERELGVSPLPETRQAYEAALANQGQAAPKSRKVSARWTVLPSLELPMIGRDDAFSQLHRAMARSRPGAMLFISGEPGVGKSRLLQEFASGYQDHLVLSGACYRNGFELPFQPLIQALRPALAERSLWQTIRPIWLAEVATILPEVEEHFDRLPARLGIQPDQAQARIFEALAQVISGLASQRQLLLCLDDLHWADEASLAWLTYIAGRRAAARVRLIATFRNYEAGRLTGLRQSLARTGLQEEVALSGLSVEAIASIIGQLPSSSSRYPLDHRRRLASEIHRITAGNAFFVLETLRNLLENQQLGKPIESMPLAPTVQAAVRRRLERLDPLARQIFDAASVVSPSISFEQLLPVSGRSEAEVVDAVETLVKRQLLTGSGETLQFQHELARVVVYEDLSPWRRRLLHRRAATALVEAFRGRTQQVAARIARHYEEAGEVEPAKAYYRQATSVAQEQYAYQEANRYLQRILDLTPQESVDAMEIAQLYEALAGNSAAIAHFKEAEQACRQALEAGPPGPSLWRVDMLRKLAATIKPGMRFQEADELYQQALTILDQVQGESEAERQYLWLRLQLDRQDLFYFQARADDMSALTAEIEPVVRALDRPELWSQYYASLTRIRSFQERFMLSAETVKIGRDRLKYAEQSGSLSELAEQQFGLGFILLWSGDLKEAPRQLQRALATCEEIGHTYVIVQCLSYLTIAHRLRGEVEQTRRYLQQTLQLTDAQKHRYYLAVEHTSLAWLAYQDSNWAKALSEAQAAQSLWAGTNYPFRWLAHWITMAHNDETGDVVAAAESAEDMLTPSQQRLPDDVTEVLQDLVSAVSGGDEATGWNKLAETVELAKGYGYL